MHKDTEGKRENVLLFIIIRSARRALPALNGDANIWWALGLYNEKTKGQKSRSCAKRWTDNEINDRYVDGGHWAGNNVIKYIRNKYLLSLLPWLQYHRGHTSRMDAWIELQYELHSGSHWQWSSFECHLGVAYRCRSCRHGSPANNKKVSGAKLKLVGN